MSRQITTGLAPLPVEVLERRVVALESAVAALTETVVFLMRSGERAAQGAREEGDLPPPATGPKPSLRN